MFIYIHIANNSGDGISVAISSDDLPGGLKASCFNSATPQVQIALLSPFTNREMAMLSTQVCWICSLSRRWVFELLPAAFV